MSENAAERLAPLLAMHADAAKRAGVMGEEVARTLELLTPHFSAFRDQVADILDALRHALRPAVVFASEALRPVFHQLSLYDAAQAKGRRRRKLINQIARERGVRPSEIRREVARLRAQY